MITVYDAPEDASAKLAELLEFNNKVHDTLGKKLEECHKLYDQSANVDQKSVDPFDSIVGFDSEKFATLAQGVGNGLEFMCGVEVSVYKNKYSISVGTVSNPDYLLPNTEEYSTIADLVEGIKDTISSQAQDYHGAKIKPFIYTFIEELRIDPDDLEGESSLKECFENMLEENVSVEMRTEVEDALINFDEFMITPIRGLNASEQAEFNKLFYNS